MAVINTRLENYVTDKNIIDDCQAGFRKGIFTTDNIFILHNLIDIICKSKKKIFCAFIDLKQAFDKIFRGGLWQKMFSYNIKGKCLNVIRNMYRNIKSCVQVNGNNSTFFTSNIRVRQGKNLFPFLFNIRGAIQKFVDKLNIFFIYYQM